MQADSHTVQLIQNDAADFAGDGHVVIRGQWNVFPGRLDHADFAAAASIARPASSSVVILDLNTGLYRNTRDRSCCGFLADAEWSEMPAGMELVSGEIDCDGSAMQHRNGKEHRHDTGNREENPHDDGEDVETTEAIAELSKEHRCGTGDPAESEHQQDTTDHIANGVCGKGCQLEAKSFGVGVEDLDARLGRDAVGGDRLDRSA